MPKPGPAGDGMAKKRAGQKGRDFDEHLALIAKAPRPGLPDRQPPQASRFQRWPTARLRAQLETNKQKLSELKQADPSWRLWEIDPAQPVGAEAMRLTGEVQEI